MLPIGAASPAAPVKAAASYDRQRVAAHVAMLADTIGVRAAGTAGEQAAASYIAAQLAALGLEVTRQPFTYTDGISTYTSANVVATKPGDGRHGTIYVGAHYDSVPAGPGANDNASGVAVLLELARLLAPTPLGPSVVFVAFGAEERGLIGSYAFVRELSPLDKLVALGMLNMDCVGVGSAQLIGTRQNTPPELVTRAAAVAEGLGYTVETSFTIGNSDHSPFASAGIPAAFVATRYPAPLCGPNYHRATDTSNTLDPAQMERVGAIVRATIEDLARTAPLVTPTQVRLPLMSTVR